MKKRCEGTGARVSPSDAQSPRTPSRCPACSQVVPVGKDSLGLYIGSHDFPASTSPKGSQ